MKHRIFGRRTRIADSKLGALGRFFGGFIGAGFGVFWINQDSLVGNPSFIAFGVVLILISLAHVAIGIYNFAAKPADRIGSTELVDISSKSVKGNVCSNCGNEVPKQGNFCATCGTKIKPTSE